MARKVRNPILVQSALLVYSLEFYVDCASDYHSFFRNDP